MSISFARSLAVFVLGGSAVALNNAALYAADLRQPTPAGIDWSGPSLGLSLTNLWGSASVNAPNIGKLDALSFNGPGLGLTLGYDYQVSPALILGGAADFNLSASRFDASLAGESLNMREYASWALRGRVGTEVGDATLVYGTAGFSQMFGDASLQGAVNANSQRQAFDGAVFGFGVETRFDANMFARFEYLHGVYERHAYAGGLMELAPSTDSARFTLVLRPDGAATAHSERAPVDWNGLYVGAFGGWERNRLALASGADSIAGLGGAGVSGAAAAGYNMQMERSVLGLEGEISANSAKASLSDTSGDTANVSSPLEAAGRLRFGTIVTANTMIYGAVGGAWTREKIDGSLGGASESRSKDFAGLQYGFGFETMLTPHIGARVEYLETRYAKQNTLTPTTAKTQSGLIYKF